MKISTTIEATFTVPGLHHWPGAHQERAYLRDPHRHLFHVSLTAEVTHDDRDIEWHDLGELAEAKFKELAEEYRDGLWNFGARSCETLARQLLVAAAEEVPTLVEVRVGEDGEFTATARTAR